MMSKIRHAWQTYTELPDFGWARVVSDLFSPPVIWGALAFPIALRDAPDLGLALMWAGIYVALVCIVPLAYITLMVKRGKIADIHLGVRGERIKPLMVTLFSSALALVVLWAIGAPSVVPLLALTTLVQMAVLAVITLTWQISMHAMSSGAAVVGSTIIYGPIATFITVPMLLLVGWARLHLHKHTRAQVLAGATLGVLIPAVILGRA
jgi:ABC-type Fe3+ transport system permease subunit